MARFTATRRRTAATRVPRSENPRFEVRMIVTRCRIRPRRAGAASASEMLSLVPVRVLLSLVRCDRAFGGRTPPSDSGPRDARP